MRVCNEVGPGGRQTIPPLINISFSIVFLSLISGSAGAWHWHNFLKPENDLTIIK